MTLDQRAYDSRYSSDEAVVVLREAIEATIRFIDEAKAEASDLREKAHAAGLRAAHAEIKARRLNDRLSRILDEIATDYERPPGLFNPADVWPIVNDDVAAPA